MIQEHEDTISGFPLQWPLGWKRTGWRKRAKFRDATMSSATKDVLHELRLLGVPDRDVIVSSNVELRRDGLPYSNQRNPADPGVAVYFKLKNERRVLACDKWDRVEHNLVAIAKHVEALRGQSRWGVGSIEQALSGYKALPAPGETQRPWREVLGVHADASAAEIRMAYVESVKRAHPDHGGTPQAAQRIQEAWEQARSEGATA